MPRMPKQFVAPCLNTFRVKDSNCTYGRTKVPAYLKAAAARRFPDQYQKSIGMKIRRDPKEGMKRRYVSDADLLGAEIKTEYSPEEPLWSAEQMQKARTLLEIAARSERLQKALRANGYRGPFPRVD